MKLLHSSDWHLGCSLRGKRRYEEFASFLDWLIDYLSDADISTFIIAGDIFDTSTPGNKAQELYYDFLFRAAKLCRHIVIVAGNHDSPSFLNAPKQLLKTFNVYVIAEKAENIEDQLLILEDEEGNPELIVCAIPYLRDRDIRTAVAGESFEDKEKKLSEGIKAHYNELFTLAKNKQETLGVDVPIVATGHLFAEGGKTVDDNESERNLYIGTLAAVQANDFLLNFDYVALGHLHLPQIVSNCQYIRYSGAPLTIGFGEVEQKKSLCKVEFNKKEKKIELIEIPVFQEMRKINGDFDEILNQLRKIKKEFENNDKEVWLEINFTGEMEAANLREELQNEVQNTNIEILRITNETAIKRFLSSKNFSENGEEINLADLDREEVFRKCLTLKEPLVELHDSLLAAYREILKSIDEKDIRSE